MASIEVGNLNRHPLGYVRRYFGVIAIAWTAVVSLSLIWNLRQEREQSLEEARIQARTAHQKDVIGGGGISISVPLKPLLAVSNRRVLPMLAGHGLLWATGLLGLGIGLHQLGQRMRERERAEQALQESNRRAIEALDREKKTSLALQETMQQLEAANREITVAAQAKSEFLASMSHEILAPMTAIIGFSENTLDSSLTPAERASVVQTIQRNAQYLVELINDVLDLSRIEADRLGIERVRVSLPAIIGEIEGLMRPQAVAKNLELGIQYLTPVPETIDTDPARLRQILVNLIGNAIKFTDSGMVRMNVTFAPASLVADGRSGVLRFDIIDEGIGIPADQMGRLFLPFSQTDRSAARPLGSTGLGLTISKHIAEKLGGTITVESMPGAGSTFTATISPGPLDGIRMLDDASLSEIACQDDDSDPDGEQVLPDCRILLVEDRLDNQRLVSLILTKAGAQVVIAENGKLAVELALAATFHRRANDPKQPFDLILMDMQMPVMDGYEATRMLRQKGFAGPIVALTAHALATDREECLRAGCDDFVTKPIVRKTLMRTIASQLARARQGSAGTGASAADSAQPVQVRASDSVPADLRAIVMKLEQAVAEHRSDLIASAVNELKRLAHIRNLEGVRRLLIDLEVPADTRESIGRLDQTVRALVELCDSARGSTTDAGLSRKSQKAE